MKFARFGPAGSEIPAVIERDGTIRDIRSVTHDIDGGFLSSNPQRLMRNALASGPLPILRDAAEMRRGAPIARPGKVVSIGLNYDDHAKELGVTAPAEPVFCLKDPGTVVGPDDAVLVPRGASKTDWEVELAVVIGRRAEYLDSFEEADYCIAGYTIANDISDREFQLERGGQWDKGKSFATFNPLGPWLITADELDVSRLRLRLDLNGERQQSGSTTEMILSPVDLVRRLSQFMVLYPGDVIDTGTPAGTALAGRHPFLVPGDRMEASIDGLGRQHCSVGAA